MKTLHRLELKPNGWPTTLQKCPAGLFLFKDAICFKSEYGNNESFCEFGEAFWGGTETEADRAMLEVQPLISVWIDL